MAWMFSMWIETENADQAKAIKDYFNDRQILANGKEYKIWANESGMVTVDGISHGGITSKSDAEEMSAIGFESYKLLYNAPEFRYALTGVEVDGWREMSELEEDPDNVFLIPGFVIRKDIFEKLGGAEEMVEFNSNYLWTPYEGETWNED